VALVLILTVGTFVISLIIGKPLFLELKRKRLRAQPFPIQWFPFVNKISLYRCLPIPLKKQLQGHIQVFLAEKYFVGCGGLEITDEIKLTIVTQACLLLLNRKTDYYKDLCSILVYPSQFIVHKERIDFAGVKTHKRQILVGESWDFGKVVISWEEAKRDTLYFRNGSNVVLHEFAHQLDHEQGDSNGVPVLENKASYVTWAKEFSKEYQKFCRTVVQGKSTVMDEYAAIDPAEFFAVATETFFEKPIPLKNEHQALYKQLQNYYKVDPSEWTDFQS
jgi:Mlc titration factor MtfA (ptsG expression regulator)